MLLGCRDLYFVVFNDEIVMFLPVLFLLVVFCIFPTVPVDGHGDLFFSADLRFALPLLPRLSVELERTIFVF